MKNRLVVLGLILACLLSISFVSCGDDGNDDPDPPITEQLAGKYTLIEIKVENIGKTIIIEPPNISGTLHLNSEGSWLMNMVASDVELNERIDGTYWEADQKTITSRNGDQITQTNYTLN
ncbi:MAG: hypothetical protein OXU27_17985 [Candidatus Poribacteria bacterium]|nr:hypothetical protein [Candidatus Poribacteria bacterium]